MVHESDKRTFKKRSRPIIFLRNINVFIFYTLTCAAGIMASNSVRKKIEEGSSNSIRSRYIRLSASNLGKRMFPLPPQQSEEKPFLFLSWLNDLFTAISTSVG